MGLLGWEGLQRFWNKCKAAFVTKDENGNVKIRNGAKVTFYNKDESDYCALECEEDGTLSLNGNTVATLDDIPSGGGVASGEPSIPSISFGCYSPEFTVADLMNELPSAVWTSGQPAIVNFMGMVSGTFLCKFSEYHSGYYGCEFTDLTNLKTYRFEGYSSELSLYNSLSDSGSSEASMPRIRLSNWEYITPAVMINRYPLEFEGEIKFSVCVQDGTVQEGDELEICALGKTFGKYKLRQFSKRVITAEDIENLDKQPFLQTVTDVKDFFRTDSAMEWNKKPKYIRIRRPIYKEDVEGPVSAIFSNVVPVDIGLSYTQ